MTMPDLIKFLYYLNLIEVKSYEKFHECINEDKLVDIYFLTTTTIPKDYVQGEGKSWDRPSLNRWITEKLPKVAQMYKKTK
jgi:hypothetical protein